jgi:hypothetical protein
MENFINPCGQINRSGRGLINRCLIEFIDHHYGPVANGMRPLSGILKEEFQGVLNIQNGLYILKGMIENLTELFSPARGSGEIEFAKNGELVIIIKDGEVN